MQENMFHNGLAVQVGHSNPLGMADAQVLCAGVRQAAGQPSEPLVPEVSAPCFLSLVSLLCRSLACMCAHRFSQRMIDVTQRLLHVACALRGRQRDCNSSRTTTEYTRSCACTLLLVHACCMHACTAALCLPFEHCDAPLGAGVVFTPE